MHTCLILRQSQLTGIYIARKIWTITLDAGEGLLGVYSFLLIRLLTDLGLHTIRVLQGIINWLIIMLQLR